MDVLNRSEIETWLFDHAQIQGHVVTGLKGVVDGKEVNVLFRDETTSEVIHVEFGNTFKSCLTYMPPYNSIVHLRRISNKDDCVTRLASYVWNLHIGELVDFEWKEVHKQQPSQGIQFGSNNVQVNNFE